ncbi:MAG: hypothetical protein IJM02_00500, partial [Clostridia bacterium]|nr:hypothetical protein [Clostridia bacterium]
MSADVGGFILLHFAPLRKTSLFACKQLHILRMQDISLWTPATREMSADVGGFILLHFAPLRKTSLFACKQLHILRM